MHVLHVCAGNLYGGVERIVAECAVRRRVEPAMETGVAVCHAGRLASEIMAAGAACAVLGDVRVSRPHTVLRARRRLGDLVRTRRPDVAVCHSAWTFGLAAPVLARHGVPAAIWIHDRLSGSTWVERWAARSKPALVICNSDFTAAAVPSLFPDVPRVVIHAPVAAADDRDVRDRLRTSLGADARTCVVLIAARFEAWKGHRELLDALAGIPEPWQLWIAGSPQKRGEPEREAALRAHCDTARIADRVRFLGHRPDVRALMRAADLYCQPNTAPEPFGLAFVEALSAGLPVVTTAMGGALEIVDARCGVTVSPADPGALRDTLRSLINDPERRSRLALGGPSRASALCDPARQLARLAGALRTLHPSALQQA